MAVSSSPVGGRLHIVDSGPRSGRPVLLFHGLGSSAREIALPLADHLERAGLRVAAIDRPGYGDSDPSPPEGRGPAAQAHRILRSLTSDLVAGAILIGHSLGAAVAVHLAYLLNGRTGGLVLVNPFCRPTRPAAAPLLRLAETPVVGPVFRRKVAPKLADSLLRSVLKASFAPDPIAEPVSRLPASPFVSENAILAMIGDLRGFNADMDALRPRLGEIQCPCVILSALDDRVIEAPVQGAWLADRLPNAIHVRLRGGHMLHHVRPRLVAACARAFADAGLPLQEPA